jgi:thymidine kinase
MNGEFRLILGSMKSGKSSVLINDIDQYKYADKKSVLIRPVSDTRNILSRKGEAVDADIIKCSNLNDVWDDLQKYDVICIDEGQFIKDLGYNCNRLANEGKIVIVAALAGSSELTAWPEISEALPYADYIEKVDAVCEKCKDNTKPTFTFFCGSKKPGEVIIGDSQYKALCRDCWKKETERPNKN